MLNEVIFCEELGLGWQIDHVVCYFGFTVMFGLAWPRPIVVGGALMAAAMPLEALDLPAQ
jgi:hypothetical protein